MRNAASFEQSVRQARIQRGFFGIASALAEPLSQSATLDAVAHAASEALGGSFAAVLMPGAGGLELVAFYGLPGEMAQALTEGVPESATALAGAARDRRLLSASSLPDDDRFGADWHRLARESGVASLLAIPVAALISVNRAPDSLRYRENVSWSTLATKSSCHPSPFRSAASTPIPERGFPSWL